jgi:hypothetical protein
LMSSKIMQEFKSEKIVWMMKKPRKIMSKRA